MVDVELYGGKRGFFEHVRARALYAFGAYHNVRGAEWSAVRRLVFVCRGNICRSPYACARARALGVPSVSFGLDAVDGVLADPMASRNAGLRGVDLSAHRSAQFDSSRIAGGDLVIVFEPRQFAEVRRRSAGRSPAISLLGIFTRPVRPHIQDPHGRSDRYFQQCFSVIDANVADIARRIAGSKAAADGDEIAAIAGETTGSQSPRDRTLA